MPENVSGVEIQLDHVSKRYPGTKEPAVRDVTMTIPAGKIVILVGPSGSGKTTTMRMINRLIEPTSGTITIGGEDALSLNPDTLRRKVGYAIQQAGLFPHFTVAQNIAVVPGLLGWDKKKINDRVHEMMDLVGLDPDEYGKRYPRQLSGGQQQRVGVARALAADPPVLLMDEPFGAVDPITRGNLQDELLRLQTELRKTIVFVTHDFDEAVKLGDWIVVFREGAHIVQYDTPERILAEPADEFVESFIGSGAGLKQLGLQRVRDVDLAEAITVRAGEKAADALAQAEKAGHGHVVVLDERDRPLSWPSIRELSRMTTISAAAEPRTPIVGSGATLNDALDEMLVSSAGAALVTGRRGVFAGVITIEVVMAAISAVRAAAGAEMDGAPVGINTGTSHEDSGVTAGTTDG